MSWMVSNKRSLLRQQIPMFLQMALMTAIYTCQIFAPWEWQLPFMAIPANVVESGKLLRAGEFDFSASWSALTLISYSFLHADMGHLLGNLVFYWIFGALINDLLGWRWLLGIVLLTAFGGGIAHTAMHSQSCAPMIGASGVVSGFMGAYLGLAVRWQLPDPHIWPMAREVPPANLAFLAVAFIALDYGAIFNKEVSMTAFGAHVGGFTMGLFLACFITPRPAKALSKRQ